MLEQAGVAPNEPEDGWVKPDTDKSSDYQKPDYPHTNGLDSHCITATISPSIQQESLMIASSTQE